MGYLLPVSNFQYNDYHNRETTTRNDPYPINEVYHTQLSNSYEDEEWIWTKRYPSQIGSKKKDNLTNPQSTYNNTLAEITGKGKNLDIII